MFGVLHNIIICHLTVARGNVRLLYVRGFKCELTHSQNVFIIGWKRFIDSYCV
jgi:hypothetical protein